MPFDFSKVRICSDDLSPISLHSLVGPGGAEVLKDPRRIILKTQAEIEETPLEAFVTPHTDPLLRQRGEMLKLIRALAAGGRITWRRRCLSKVGVFAVEKKDGSQRLIFDCRPGGALCRPAPHTELSTAGALAELDWSDLACGVPAGGSGPEVCFSGADLTDAFYQFGMAGPCRPLRDRLPCALWRF